ncbi:MAG: hypothetical protein K2Q97_05965 [Burkholderiaceae bacterium]|nr:hypothetical protein [Burkholderiaceae bacterium]
MPVGFDLPEGKSRAQLQCLAKTTGGRRYVEARYAVELNTALGQIAQAAPVPAPAPVAKAKPIENLKSPKGCMLYDQDNYKGQSLLVGESGYADEMPSGWDNRVRSLKCSARRRSISTTITVVRGPTSSPIKAPR